MRAIFGFPRPSAQRVADHDEHYLNVMGRLNTGVSLGQAQSELDLIARRLQRQYPIDDKERGLRLLPLPRRCWATSGRSYE